MPSVIKSVSFDAADALVLARFWAAVFGSDVDEDSTVAKAFVEVSRLEKLGATVVRVHPGHTEMQDPEGNEFCVEPGPDKQGADRLESSAA